MIRLSSTIFILFCLVSQGWAQLLPQNPALGSGRSVVLVTIGPGDEVYEQYGHNMIQLRGDPGYRQDVLYHWGLFDPTESGFVWTFIQGRMMYSMVAEPSDVVMEEYRKQGRLVIYQQLNLTEPQIEDLIMKCEINRKPFNAKYRYDYYRDNCSTRVRDMLDKVMDGQISQAIKSQTPAVPMTYRQHTMRLVQQDFFLSLGMDFVIGPSCDVPLSAWEETFLPLRMSQYLAPIAVKTWSPWESVKKPEAQNPPDRKWLLLGAGVLIAAMIVLASMSRTRPIVYLPILLTMTWWLISGFGGLLLLYMWLFTDHEAAHRNQNLLAFTPWSWWVIYLMDQVYRKHSRRCMTIARFLVTSTAILTVSALILHGWLLKQDNLQFLLLALPINLVVLWIVLVSQKRLTSQLQKGEVVQT